MEDLKELVDIISIQKLSQFEMLGSKKNKSKINQLYCLLRENSDLTDEEACQSIYGTRNLNPSYKKLKYRLKQRVFDLMFVTNSFKQKSEIHDAYHRCHRNYSLIQLLLSFSKRILIFDLAEKTIQTCIYYEFTNLVFLISQLLIQQSEIDGDIQKVKKFQELNNKYIQYAFYENKVINYYSELQINYLNRRGPLSKNQITRCENIYMELNEINESFNSYRFHRFYIKVALMYFRLKNDFQSQLNIVQQGLSFYNNKSYTTKEATFSLNIYLLFLYIKYKKYEDGDLLVEQILYGKTDSTLNQIVFNFYAVLLMFHSKNYSKCFKLIKNTISQKKFNTVRIEIQQNFYVLEALIHFLLSIKKVEAILTPMKKFRVNRFLNEVPIFSKDKRGLNVMLIITQILFLLEKRNYNRIIDKMESLIQYSYRYLKNDETFRSNCFIKMLVQMIKADFNPIRTRRYSEKLLLRLKENPLKNYDQAVEVEIIPFEDLWEIILELLDRKN